jgi:hypothetical protein
LNRPEILAIEHVALAHVQPARIAQDAAALASHLHDGHVLGVVGNVERHGEQGPFGQHRLAHIGAERVGGATEQVELIGGEN